jgi:hypothetical protein
MDSPGTPDIVAFLQSAEKWIGDELDLNELRAGDRLLVRTRNTHYLFAMKGGHTAELSCDRADRPRGPVQIQGCVFGQSRMIKPGHLFCGGALEISLESERRTFVTTPIEAIQLVKSAPSMPA